MRRKAWSAAPLAALMAALALLVSACGGGATSGGEAGGAGPSESEGGGQPILVATIGARSGQLASLGDWDWKGFNLAIQEANDAGGIHGRTIKILEFNDQGDPTVGVNVAKDALSQGIVAAMATPESTVALAVKSLFQDAKVVQITSGQALQLTEPGDPYIFRDTAPSSTIDRTLAEYAVNTKGFKKIAMITNNGSYGKGEHDAFIASLKDLGVEPVADVVVTPDQKEFSSVLAQIRDTGPDALFIGAEEVESGLIAKQARALGITATLIAGSPFVTPVFRDTAGCDAVEGAIMSTTYLGNEASDETRAFAAKYKQAYGEDPELHGAKAYDAGRFLVLAMQAAWPNIDGEHIAQALHQIEYDGLQGHFKFDANGEGLASSLVGTIQGCQVVPVK